MSDFSRLTIAEMRRVGAAVAHTVHSVAASCHSFGASAALSQTAPSGSDLPSGLRLGSRVALKSGVEKPHRHRSGWTRAIDSGVETRAAISLPDAQSRFFWRSMDSSSGTGNGGLK